MTACFFLYIRKISYTCALFCLYLKHHLFSKWWVLTGLETCTNECMRLLIIYLSSTSSPHGPLVASDEAASSSLFPPPCPVDHLASAMTLLAVLLEVAAMLDPKHELSVSAWLRICMQTDVCENGWGWANKLNPFFVGIAFYFVSIRRRENTRLPIMHVFISLNTMSVPPVCHCHGRRYGLAWSTVSLKECHTHTKWVLFLGGLRRIQWYIFKIRVFFVFSFFGGPGYMRHQLTILL